MIIRAAAPLFCVAVLTVKVCSDQDICSSLIKKKKKAEGLIENSNSFTPWQQVALIEKQKYYGYPSYPATYLS